MQEVIEWVVLSGWFMRAEVVFSETATKGDLYVMYFILGFLVMILAIPAKK